MGNQRLHPTGDAPEANDMIVLRLTDSIMCWFLEWTVIQPPTKHVHTATATFSSRSKIRKFRVQINNNKQKRSHDIYYIILDEIKVLDLASNCIFYFATADGKESDGRLHIRS